MAVRSNIVTLVSAFAMSWLIACGGSTKQAKGPEANPWADYKGTYAMAAPATKEGKTEASKSEAPKDAHVANAEAMPVEATPVPAPKKAKSASKSAKAGAKKK